MNQRTRRCLLTFLLLALAGCHRKPGLDAASLGQGIETYLAQRGDLCIARQGWPVDVRASDRAVRTRDATQMPVLERLGVVEGHEIDVRATSDEGAPVVVPVTRYELTERGRRSYIDRRTRRPIEPRAGTAAPEGQADLCVARVSLDRVVSWEASPGNRVSVSYTYKIDAASWMRDPEALRVFPAIARVIAGAGKAELKESLVLTGAGWVAVELGAPPAASAPAVAARQDGRP
jgi:hypothetical protein